MLKHSPEIFMSISREPKKKAYLKIADLLAETGTCAIGRMSGSHSIAK
jgi:hypothetical protein